MVVDTMTFKEIWSEINKDRDGIIKHKLEDANKALRKKVLASSNNDKIIRLAPIHLKSRTTNLNHCLIVFCLGKNDFKKKGPIFILYSYIYWKFGIHAFMLGGNFDMLNVYTPHFFDRYRERNLAEPTWDIEKVMEIYFINNSVTYNSAAIETGKAFNEKYPNSIFASTNEGVLLGTKHPDNIYEYKTFLSKNLLRVQQTDLNLTQDEIIKKYQKEMYGTDTISQE